MGLWQRLFGGPPARDPRDVPTAAGAPATPPIYRPPGLWTMEEVDTALQAHENGHFYQSGRLVDALLCDESIDSLLGLITGTVIGLPGYFELPSAPGEPVEVRGLEEDWQLVFSAEVCKEVLSRLRLMGFALAYDSRETLKDIPQWRCWPPYGCYYDISRNVWRVEDRIRGYVDIQPGDGRWALFQARGTAPWLAGAVRSVAPLMVIRQATLFNWANHATVYGTPSRVLTIPARMAEHKDVRATFDAIKEMVGDSAFALLGGDEKNPGMKLDLLELKQVTYEIYERLRRAIDESMAVLFVGQQGTTKAAGGWGSAHTEKRVTQQILEALVAQLQPTVHRDIMAPYDRWKRGTLDLNKVPRRVWDCTPTQDRDAAARRASMEAQARLSDAQELDKLSKVRWPAEAEGEEYSIDLAPVVEARGLRAVKVKKALPPPKMPPPLPRAAQEAA